MPAQIPNYTTHRVMYDFESPEWDSISFSHQMCDGPLNSLCSEFRRKAVRSHTNDYIILGNNSNDDRMPGEVLSELNEIITYLDITGTNPRAKKYIEELVNPFNEPEMLTYLERENCTFFKEIQTPIIP